MNNTTTTNSKTLNLITKLDVYVGCINDDGIQAVLMRKLDEVHDSYTILHDSARTVEAYSQTLQTYMHDGNSISSVVDSLAIEVAKLPVAEARFDNALSDIRMFLYHVVAQTDADKAAVKALFIID